MSTHDKKKDDDLLDEEILGVIAACVGALVAAWFILPSLIVGALFYEKVWRFWPKSAYVAVVGAIWVVGMWLTGILPNLYGEAWMNFKAAGGFKHLDEALGASFPELAVAWLVALPITPAICWAFEGLLPDNFKGEPHEIEKYKTEGKNKSRDVRAARLAGQETETSAQTRKDAGLVLGYHSGGEKPLPLSRKGQVLLTQAALTKHGVVVGSPGSGKTETLMRIAYTVAKDTGWSVYFLDCKGSVNAAKQFCRLMLSAGRKPALFPEHPFNGWQGSPESIYSRLVEMIDWSKEGDGAYYRDLAKSQLALVCDLPDGPPRSSDELLARLDYRKLKALHTEDRYRNSLEALKEDSLLSTRARYQGFFLSLKDRLDGQWSWDNTSCGYLLLPMTEKDTSKSLARFLFEDFVDYCLNRKDPRKRALLIVDEFSAIAEVGGMAEKIEKLRECGGAVLLSAQSFHGMGGEEEARRILGSAHLKLVHQTPMPEQFVELAGTKQVMERSMQYLDSDPTGMTSSRIQHQYSVDPNEVRSLPVGACYAIAQGKACKLRVVRAPITPSIQ